MTYRISELAERCGVNKETIRYYERLGLISEPSRTNAGYRMYSEEFVNRLRFIKRMQDLGFSLAEINKLLGIVDKDNERCKDMYDFVVQKTNEVQKKIKDLKRIEHMLINLKDCCNNTKEVNNETVVKCPSCKNKSKNVKLITLKSMLKPSALETLNAKANHYFCSTKDCDVVYFDSNNKEYLVSDIKVAVHQKDDSPITPICYCFDWTKEKIKQYVKEGITPHPVEHIRENIKENRCGCEINNPQGSCCLGNVTKFINQFS